MKRANHWLSALGLIAMLAFAQGVLAATCTSISSARWDRNNTWSCGHVPTSADTVVIASGFTVSLRGASGPIAALTIDAGGIIDDRGNSLTVNGSITVNGTFGVVGGGGTLIAAGANATISGTGTFADTILQIDNSATIAAGSTLNFSAGGMIDVGPNAPPPNTVTLNIAGSVTGAGQTAGNTILNGNGFSSINITGSINSPASDISLVAGDILTSNGTVSVQTVTASGGSTWTQGANSSLTLGSTAGFQGTLNASANGNTVNYPAGTAPIIPSGNTYFNISGPTCPQVAGLIILGTGPCNGGAVSQTVTMSPTLCVNDPGIGTQPWSGLANVGTQNNVYAQASGILGQITNYLKCTGYNFNIPAGATINGITVGVWRYSAKTMSDQATQLVKASGIQPTNLATLTRFPTTNTQVLYGGTTNLWGNTWTPTEINAAGFGAAFAAVRGVFASTDTAFVDYMPITVTYTVPSGPDHIEIDHAGSALTCSPQTVTIKACANAACTTLYSSGGVNVTLTPGGLTFAIGVSGTNNSATVQQSTAGTATLAATSSPAAANAATCLNTATATASCVMTFSNSGFLVTVPNHTSCTNATTTIEAVQAAPGTGRCVPAYQNVTRAVNLYTSYTNPATGTLGVTASTGAVSTAAPGTAHNLAFDATGKATITLNYPDAGQLTLTANDTAPTGAAMTGSGAFIAAPASFAFSGIPAAPLTAGQPFNATVTAMNACATPAPTPNFNSSVTLTSSNPLPGIGNATAINAALSGFSNGVASTNLTWNEVGTIDLNASMSAYLGWTLPTAVTGTQTGVGRFQPAYFNTTVTPACGTFTYAGSITPAKAGQPFAVTVTANRLGGGVTKNYAGAYAYSTTLSNAGVTTGFASNTIAPAGYTNGVGSANVTYAVATPQNAPLTLALRATDADPITPVSSLGHTEATTAIRSGRAKLVNAYGSELLTLSVPFRAEYWNGGWVTNSADTCSGDGLQGGAVSVALSVSPVTCVQDNGNPGRSGAGCAVAGPAGQRFSEGGVAGFAGDFNLWLRAPGAGNTGAVTVTGNVPTWLQYPWAGGAVINPTGLATFGVYKGGNEFIYMRETY